MTNKAKAIGRIIRDALTRQMTAEGKSAVADVLRTAPDDSDDTKMGETIIETHNFDTRPLRTKLLSHIADLKALNQIRERLIARPHVTMTIDSAQNGNIAEIVDEAISDLQAIKRAITIVLELETPTRQNQNAARVAFCIAHLFRSYDLTPSAAKQGSKPSSIFGQCVSDVFRLLDETTGWRRVSENAVTNGVEYDEKMTALNSLTSQADQKMAAVTPNSI